MVACGKTEIEWPKSFHPTYITRGPAAHTHTHTHTHTHIPPLSATMKEQVLAWLDEEETYVTAQRISQTNDGGGLSRRAASDLLREIYDGNNSGKYVPTLCSVRTTAERSAAPPADADADVGGGRITNDRQGGEEAPPPSSTDPNGRTGNDEGRRYKLTGTWECWPGLSAC